MKKIIFPLWMMASFLLLVSCTNDAIDNIEDNALTTNASFNFESNILRVENREALQQLIDHGLPPSTRASKPFLSMMDVVNPRDPRLDSLSQEEKDTIMNNQMTYYELFGFADIIPNENFARLISPFGDIIVDDTLYRITTYGTAYTHYFNRLELDTLVKRIPHQANLFPHNEQAIALSPRVKMINSFHYAPPRIDNLITEEYTFDVGDDFGGGSGSGTGTGTGTGSGNGNTALNNIPFSSFPTFSSSSHTFVGNAMDWLLGERHTRHHEFINGYRVGGSLYDYNYGVYQECGTLVKMEKKRGGLFRLINGWKNINANELVIHFDKMALKKSGSNPDYMFDNYGNPSYKGFGDFNSSWKHVFITAKYWSDQDVANIFADGVNNAIARLSTATNATIPPAARSFMIMTKNACYRYMYDVTKYANNDKKLRMVFDSGVNIVLYYDSEKTIVANIYNNLKNLLTNRDFDIIDGQVKLAGRLNSNWGGMIINKD